MKLYEITGEILRAIELYNSVETDEDLQAAEEALNALQVSFNEKAVGVAKFVLNTEAQQSAVEHEIARLTDLREVLKKRSARFRQYLHQHMTATNTQEIDGTIFKIKVRKNPPFVVVEDELKVPDRYIRKRTITEIDKAAIKDAWKSGTGVAGTRVEQGTRVEIK